MEKLSVAMENYLEAIYELSGDDSGVRLTDIARRLGVTKASANSAMAVLAERGLVVNERYQTVRLTCEGRRAAAFTSCKHQVILRFFTQVLGIQDRTADDDACAIEHVISDDAVRAMERFLERGGGDGGPKIPLTP